MNFKCYLNGKEVLDQSLVEALNQNEIPIFESFRVYNGVVFRLEEHLKRLSDSAKSCGVDLPRSAALGFAVQKAMQAHGAADGFIRLNFQSGNIFVMIGERKHNSEIYQTGVDLKTSSFRMPSPGESIVQAKTGNYRLQLLQGAERGVSLQSSVVGRQSFEWLFLDENHFLTEARVGNYFMVKKGQIWTPPSMSVLNGITREVVIECARESGIQVKEIPLSRHDAFNADEAFLTNTSWEILPVRSLDGREVQETIPGPVTQKLIQFFKRKVKNECQPQKKLSPIQKLNAPSSRSRIKKG